MEPKFKDLGISLCAGMAKFEEALIDKAKERAYKLYEFYKDHPVEYASITFDEDPDVNIFGSNRFKCSYFIYCKNDSVMIEANVFIQDYTLRRFSLKWDKEESKKD